MTLVGAPPNPAQVAVIGLLFKRRRLAGSIIGGIKETQEMLDFCAEKNVTADVEVIPMQDINKAYDRLLKNGQLQAALWRIPTSSQSPESP